MEERSLPLTWKWICPDDLRDAGTQDVMDYVPEGLGLVQEGCWEETCLPDREIPPCLHELLLHAQLCDCFWQYWGEGYRSRSFMLYSEIAVTVYRQFDTVIFHSAWSHFCQMFFIEVLDLGFLSQWCNLMENALWFEQPFSLECIHTAYFVMTLYKDIYEWALSLKGCTVMGIHNGRWTKGNNQYDKPALRGFPVNLLPLDNKRDLDVLHYCYRICLMNWPFFNGSNIVDESTIWLGKY